MPDPGQVTNLYFYDTSGNLLYTIPGNRLWSQGTGTPPKHGIEGLDTPPYRVSESPLAGMRGVQYNQSLSDKRAVIVDFLISKADLSSYLAERATIFNTFNAESTASPTIKMVVEVNNTTQYKLTVVPADVILDLQAAGASWSYCQIKLIAYDPVVYSNTTHSVSGIAVPGGGGATFPLVFPITFTTQNTGTTFVNNAGNLYDPPIITLTNDLTNPIITNVTTGEYFQLTTTTSVGDSVVIDMGARTVVKNGVTSLLTAIAAGTTWWTLRPGSTTVRISTSNTADGGTMAISYNDAFNAVPGV